LKKRIALRTKGNHLQGMGDLTGSVALAHEFHRNGHQVIFIIEDDEEAIEMIRKEKYPFFIVNDRSEEDVWEEIGEVHIAIVNQLNTGREILTVIKERTKKLVTIDDTGDASRRLADLRINPLYYDRGALCDPKFIPLHPTFQEAHRLFKGINEKVLNILLTLGGSDTYGFTPKLICFLDNFEFGAEVHVLLGPGFKHFTDLKTALRKTKTDINVMRCVTPREMCSLISEADLVICSGGNTMFEVACLGRPSIIVCCEPFEEETATRLMDMGIVFNLGFGEKVTEKIFSNALNDLISNYSKRKKMGEAGYQTVDGKGIERIYEVIISN